MNVGRKTYWMLLALVCVACSSPDAESYYREGRALREADEPVAAMEAFIAATRVRSHEYGFKGRSFSNMATMCRKSERHELAYTLYEQSAEQFVLANDSLAYSYALNNMAWEKAVQADKETALMLVDSAVRFYPDERITMKVQETRAAACLYAEEYDSVLYYTQARAAEEVYFAILRAQAYTFLESCDSALLYAHKVLDQTDNPRYLDDVYYMLAHCNNNAVADEIRKLAAERTDIQRSLERNNPEWTKAMLLAEASLQPQKHPFRWIWWVVIAVGCALAVWWWCKRTSKETKLKQQCSTLRHSNDLRTEIQWEEYKLFRETCNTRLFGIVDKLQQRGLNEREIRMSVLFMIGLSYADIAAFLYRAENGIGKDKYMIAKHLGVSVKQLQSTLIKIACGH